jgi:hypothetical protein
MTNWSIHPCTAATHRATSARSLPGARKQNVGTYPYIRTTGKDRFLLPSPYDQQGGCGSLSDLFTQLNLPASCSIKSYDPRVGRFLLRLAKRVGALRSRLRYHLL